MNTFAKLSYLNIFRKFYIFSKYLSDNLSNSEFRVIWFSLKYLFTKKSNSTDLVIKTNNGLFFIRKNTIDFKLANSAYEYPVLKKFRQILPQYDLFIDVGSNIGTYSIIAARQGLKCICFEPVVNNFKVLEKNIRINNLNQLVKPIMVGLSSKKEKTEFNYDPLKPGASGIYHTKRKGGTFSVQLEIFDDLAINELENSENILIKIDVEGMELNVLEGMENLLKNRKTGLIIETKHSGESNIKELLQKFDKFKFEKIDEFNMLALKYN